MTVQANSSTRSPSPVETLLALVNANGPSLHGGPSVDWERVLALAERHWLEPLLHERLQPLLDALPQRVRSTLHRARMESAAHTMFHEWEQRQIVQTFQEQKIPLILFKGIPLAQQLYGDPTLRRTCDIDVLVHVEDIAVSRRLVEELGWSPKESWQSFVDKNYDYTKEINGATAILELHWSNQREGEYHLPEARLWQEAVETEAGWLFTREMTLLTLVLHTVRHAFRPYRQLVDIAHAVATWNDLLDWERVLTLADEANAQRTLAVVLALVHRDLAAPLPQHPTLTSLLLSRRTQWTIRLLPAERLLLKSSLSTIERYWVPLASGAWQPARFFFSDLIRTPTQLAEIYNLPENSPLIPLYYLFRPLLLARKYIKQLRRNT
ncbi:MAG: nucleotidyltransferase family protein [Chloroflexota bacterium]|nr:nucleotidyltransferase family protein [Chloroflexota bacterium]